MTRPRPHRVAAALLLLSAPAISAQAVPYAEVGVAVPLGLLSSIAAPGPLVTAGLAARPAAPGVQFGADIWYARARHDAGDARSDLAGVTAWVAYALEAAGSLEVAPTLGIGALAHSRRSHDFPGLDATRAGLSLELGLVASAPVGRVRVLLSGSYLRGTGATGSAAFPTELASLTAGVVLPLGG
ncbi:MAG: hypothetical protein ABL963_15845 [Longimicrobiales bacterium]